MKRKLMPYLAMLLIALSSCKKVEEPIICCAVVDTGLSFTVSSKSNLDLLNPGTTGAYTEDKIELFDKKASGYVRVYDRNMDWPKRFHIEVNPNTGKYQISLGLNVETLSQDTSVTLVKFGDQVPDTIKAVVVREGGYLVAKDIRMNNIPLDSDKIYNLIK